MYIVCNISTFKDKITNLSKHLNIGKKKKGLIGSSLKKERNVIGT